MYQTIVDERKSRLRGASAKARTFFCICTTYTVATRKISRHVRILDENFRKRIERRDVPPNCPANIFFRLKRVIVGKILEREKEKEKRIFRRIFQKSVHTV